MAYQTIEKVEVLSQIEEDSFELSADAVDGGTAGFPDDAKQEAEAKDASATLAHLTGQSPSSADGEKTVISETLTKDEKKLAHEAREAQRKAEWEEKQAAKQAEVQQELQKIAAMSDDALVDAAIKRLTAQSEDIVSCSILPWIIEHVQTLCYENIDFARLAMHPRKSMKNCWTYINQKAYERAQKEIEALNAQATRQNPYAVAIPEDECYNWAEDYFRDQDAKVDQEKEEKFVPRPYHAAVASIKKDKKAVVNEPAKKAKIPDGQISLLE